MAEPIDLPSPVVTAGLRLAVRADLCACSHDARYPHRCRMCRADVAAVRACGVVPELRARFPQTADFVERVSPPAGVPGCERSCCS